MPHQARLRSTEAAYLKTESSFCPVSPFNWRTVRRDSHPVSDSVEDRQRHLDQLGNVAVQNAHLLACIGISLMHSGHFLVVGSAGGCRRMRPTRALMGKTTAK
jgi:hypothetical protein